MCHIITRGTVSFPVLININFIFVRLGQISGRLGQNNFGFASTKLIIPIN